MFPRLLVAAAVVWIAVLVAVCEGEYVDYGAALGESCEGMVVDRDEVHVILSNSSISSAACNLPQACDTGESVNTGGIATCVRGTVHVYCATQAGGVDTYARMDSPTLHLAFVDQRLRSATIFQALLLIDGFIYAGGRSQLVVFEETTGNVRATVSFSAGSDVTSIVADDTRAYACTTAGIEIIDVSVTEQPKRVDSVPQPCADIVLVHPFLLVAGATGALVAILASSREVVQEVAVGVQLQSLAYDASRKRLFYTAGSELGYFDVSTASGEVFGERGREVTVHGMSNSSQIAVMGGYVLACASNGVHIIGNVSTEVPDSSAPATVVPPTTEPEPTAKPEIVRTQVPQTTATVPVPGLPGPSVSPSPVLVVEPPTSETTSFENETVPAGENRTWTSLMQESMSPSALNAVTAAAVPLSVTSMLVSASGAGTGSLLLLLSSGCYTSPDQTFPLLFHPSQVDIAGSAALGMVACNYAICVGIVVSALVVHIVFKELVPRLDSWTESEAPDTQGWLRLPSVPIIGFTFLYQGTTLGTFLLLFYPPFPKAFLAGLVSFIVVSAVPVWVLSSLVTSVPRCAVFAVDKVVNKPSVVFLLGMGEWVSKVKGHHVVGRYASVLRPYSVSLPWFYFIEMARSLTLSATTAAVVDNAAACAHIKLFSGFVLAIEVILIVCYTPYAKSRDNLTLGTATLCLSTAMGLTSYGFYRDNPSYHSAASIFFVSALCLLGAKLFLDVLGELLLIVLDRRFRLQIQAHAERVRRKLLQGRPSEKALSSQSPRAGVGEEETITSSESDMLPSGVSAEAYQKYALREQQVFLPSSSFKRPRTMSCKNASFGSLTETPGRSSAVLKSSFNSNMVYPASLRPSVSGNSLLPPLAPGAKTAPSTSCTTPA
ncbi:hypothetical protein DIPPA_34253 [Diplonema papillatum]|nr:hypothetical protein DIPPA_34253 [Diplonema papillatum]